MMAAAEQLALQLRRTLDRYDYRAETSLQKTDDLGAAKRRQLQAPVGPLWE